MDKCKPEAIIALEAMAENNANKAQEVSILNEDKVFNKSITMKTTKNHWKKTELKIYVLLLCANADSIETEEEIDLIKSKTDPETFNKMYKEFSSDSEDESLEKIQQNVHLHYFSNMELIEFRKEVNEVFFTDKKFTRMERNLDRILDNILY